VLGQCLQVSPYSGNVLWQYTVYNSSEVLTWSGTALSPDGVLVAGLSTGAVYALSAATGHLLWRVQAGEAVEATPAIDSRGVVYAGGGPACVTRSWVWTRGGRQSCVL
jgi:outer membrane protein assembly factor BamB